MTARSSIDQHRAVLGPNRKPQQPAAQARPEQPGHRGGRRCLRRRRPTGSDAVRSPPDDDEQRWSAAKRRGAAAGRCWSGIHPGMGGAVRRLANACKKPLEDVEKARATMRVSAAFIFQHIHSFYLLNQLLNLFWQQDCDSCCRGFEPHQPLHRMQVKSPVFELGFLRSGPNKSRGLV